MALHDPHTLADAQALAAAFLEARRAKHGNLRMEADGDDADDQADTGAGDDGADVGADDDDKADGTADGADQLGDAGKKALDAMKAKWRAERDALKPFKALGVSAEDLKALVAASRKDGDPPDADAIRRDAETAANKKAAQRVLRSEIKAAAAGKLADPSDAYKFLDVDAFEVDDDGNVDEDEIAEAIDDLIKSKPYLAVQDGKRRFQGGADGGARKESSKSIDDQIAEAEKARNFQLAIALKQQRAASATKS